VHTVKLRYELARAGLIEAWVSPAILEEYADVLADHPEFVAEIVESFPVCYPLTEPLQLNHVRIDVLKGQNPCECVKCLAEPRRDRRAAKRFFRMLLEAQRRTPRRLITDKLRSYSAAHGLVMPSVVHSTQQYENNRAEVSHQPTRQRERQMRRFKSSAHAQRFLSVHGVVRNLFHVGRHLLRAAHHRLLRTRSFRVWNEVTGTC
jgi:putative transposase